MTVDVAPRAGPERAGSVSPRLRDALLLVATFMAIQVFAVRGLGLPFDSSPWRNYIQYVDPVLLRDDLARSLLYLHSQPPGFNLVLGLALKSADPVLAMQGFLLASGFVLYAAAYGLMRELGVGRGLAWTLSTVFALSPTFLIYERWLYYATPVAALLALSAVLFARFARTRGVSDGVGFFACLAALGLTWGLFHLVFFVLAGVLLAFAVGWSGLRRVVLCALLPGVVLSGLYVKNAMVFGHFTASTWLPMNMAIGFRDTLPRAVKVRLAGEGHISPVSVENPFSDIERYPAAVTAQPRSSGIPVLDQVRRANGLLNFNHPAYIRVADAYARDNLYLLSRYPSAYVEALKGAVATYFSSGDEYYLLREEAVAAARPLSAVYDFAYGPAPGAQAENANALPTHWRLNFVIALPALFAFGLASALPAWPGRPADPETRRRSVVVLYMLFCIAFVAATGVLFNIVETNRIRFSTDAFDIVLIGLAVERLGRRWRSRQGSNLQPPA